MEVVGWQGRVAFSPAKMGKATLFETERCRVGLNCFEPGQVQAVHEHQGTDKVYVVLEGRGTFVVGSERAEHGVGAVVLARAGVPHGVENTGPGRLVLLAVMAP